MPGKYSPEVRCQVVELARAGTKVPQLAATFGMTDATIYNWLKQEKIDRGELAGTTTDQALELAAARRRIKEFRDRARGLEEGQRGLPRPEPRPKASSR
jgi:transposase